MESILTKDKIASIKVTYEYLLADVCPEYCHVKYHVVIHKEFH
jgi:hypothetical protein